MNNFTNCKENNFLNNLNNKILDSVSTRNDKNVNHNTILKSTKEIVNHSNHINKTKFFCHYPDCHKEYRSKYNLRKHIRSHIVVLLYHCYFEGCDKTYKIQENLELHIKNFLLKEKSFKCGFCFKKFYHRNGKLYHEKKKHLNILEFKCTINACNVAYASRSALKYHLNNQHLGKFKSL